MRKFKTMIIKIISHNASIKVNICDIAIASRRIKNNSFIRTFNFKLFYRLNII